MTVPRAPLATYRLQLGEGMGFAEAERLVPYLADLGVTHLYLSPILSARPGSAHGYDVVDPGQVSPALGGEPGLRRLADTAHGRGLGVVIDIVPNHVGTGPANPWWEALLAEGRSGSAGEFFDVDWAHPLPGATDKVVVPVLGAQYGEVLTAGELRVRPSPAGWRLHYHEHSFPLAPDTVEAVERAGPEALHGEPGDPESWQRLHALLEAQHYRLVHWRAGRGLVNFRRFFAVDDLAALRVESPAVRDAAHEVVLRLVREGVVDGLRVDHPDGLRDPARYFAWLAARAGCWVVAEKILHPGEEPPRWPIAGTTGYDFLNDVLALFVDPQALPGLRALDVELGASPEEYPAQVVAAKRRMADGDLAADVDRLTRALWRLTQSHPAIRDVEQRSCREALVRVLCAFPVYRSYVDPETGEASEADAARVAEAVAAAPRDDLVPDDLLDFLALVLVGAAGDTPEHLDVVARFQQLSAALTAKGVEDTALYRDLRLTALGEVGGDPRHPGGGVRAWHEASSRRAGRWPEGMLTTSTHDTKRGEDTRLRIAALSELADEWESAVRSWWGGHRHVAPDGRVANLAYQTLVGVWPLDGSRPGADLADRLDAYLRKALREAGEATSWRDPDEAYERAAAEYLRVLLDPERSAGFLDEIGDLAWRAAEIGMVAGLAQTLLRATAPGVPDTYQGCELWDDSLVDPDNRRPVDFAARVGALAALDDGADAAKLLEDRCDGRVKLWVLSRALRARAALPGCLGPAGGYRPLDVSGEHRDHVVAFSRTGQGGPVVVVAPRLPGRLMDRGRRLPLGEVWGDTTVDPPGDALFEDLLGGPGAPGGGPAALSGLLSVLPVALLAPSAPR